MSQSFSLPVLELCESESDRTDNHLSSFLIRGSPLQLIQELPDFVQRKSPVSSTEWFQMGDELVELEVVTYQARTESTPLSLASARHRFGVPDMDTEDFWRSIHQYLELGEYPKECGTEKEKIQFQRRTQRFFLQHGRLWLAPKAKSSSLPRLVIVDKTKRGELMALAHNEVGHKGRDAVYLHLTDRFYWPNMYIEVQYFIRSCIECQKSIKGHPVIPYNVSWQAPLLRHFKIDCIHMPRGVGGFEYIVHAVEPTILWPEAKSLKSLNAANVAAFIYKSIICRFACVPLITIDGGPEFKKEVRQLLKTQYNCTVIMSTAYHPEGNGVIERAHQPLVDAIFKCTGDAKGNWPKYLEPALFAIRVTVSRSTGYSPYYLLYGMYPVFSFDITESTWQTLDWHTVRTHEDLLALRILQLQRRDPKLKEETEKLRQLRLRAIQDWERRVNYRFDFSDYEEGMWVWLRESQLDETKGNKGDWTYSGPYIVHKKLPHDAYVLRELSGAILKGNVNVHRLRLFFYRPDHQTLKTTLTPRFRQTQALEKPGDLAASLISLQEPLETKRSLRYKVADQSDLLILEYSF